MLDIFILFVELWSISRDEIIVMLNKLSWNFGSLQADSYALFLKKYDFEPNNFPNSKETYENVISLPLYPDLKDNEISFVIDTINELWDEYSI